MSNHESPEARARQRAHELLKGVCLDVDGRAVIGHARVCDGIAAELLDLYRFRDERDAARAEAEALRRELAEAAKGDSVRVRAMRSNLRRLDSDGLSRSNAEHLLSVLDACRASNAGLRGMLAEAVDILRSLGMFMHPRIVPFLAREDVQRACATEGPE